MDWINAITSAARLPARIITALWIALSVALFGPVRLVSGIGLTELLAEHRGVFGAIWLVLFVLVLTQLVGWARSKYQASVRRRARRAMTTQALGELDPQERAVLREFALQGQHTIQLPVDHSVIADLMRKGVLVQVGGFVESSALVGMLGSLRIDEHARDLIRPEMIDLPADKPTSEEVEWLHKNRPDFAQTLSDLRDLRFGRFW